MDIKKKIELEKKANSKEKGFKDKREDFFKKEEKQIQKTLYIDESIDTALQMHKVLNKENNSEAMRKALKKYLYEFENLKDFLKD